MESFDGNSNQMADGQEITLTQLLHIMKNGLGWIILSLVLCVAVAVGYLYVTVPTYEAVSTALVEPISKGSSIESLLGASTSNSNISTEVELVSSKTTLNDALALLDLSSYKDAEGVPYSELELTAGKMAKKVTVATVKTTKMISITVEDQNPKFAADYANALARAYTTLLTRIAKNSKSAQREFIESQIPINEGMLNQASEALASYREESGIIQMTEKSAILTKQIAAYQMQMEPLKLQEKEAQTLMESFALSLQAVGISVPSEEQFLADETVKKLISDFDANFMEYLLYLNVVETADTSRTFVLENALSYSSKALLDRITAIVQPNVSNQADVRTFSVGYAKAICDKLTVGTKLAVLERMESIYNEEISKYPVLERRMLELQRDVQIYEALSLTLRQMLEETKMVEAAVVGNVTVVDEAVEPEIPVSPRKLMILAVSLLLGAVLGVGLAWLLELLDYTVHSEETIKQIVGETVPSIGWIPYFGNLHKDNAKYPDLVVYNMPDSYGAERYKMVANNIVYSTPKKLQVLSINSTDMGEGKTSVIGNIAASYALMGKKVLCIDGDFRRPSIERFFDLKRSKLGLVNVIVDKTPLESCIVQPIAKIPNLHILPPGKSTRNPAALFSSTEFQEIIKKLRTVYDYIIIDSPPINYASEFAALSLVLDGVILNVRAGVSAKTALSDLVGNLKFLKVHLLGYIYFGVIAKNQGTRSTYGKYGSGGSYYSHYYQTGKDSKKLSTRGGNYRRIHRKELKLRTKISLYGNDTPVLAFRNGMVSAFSQTKVSSKIAPKASSQTNVTDDMLSEIEADSSSSGKKI